MVVLCVAALVVLLWTFRNDARMNRQIDIVWQREIRRRRPRYASREVYARFYRSALIVGMVFCLLALPVGVWAFVRG